MKKYRFIRVILCKIRDPEKCEVQGRNYRTLSLCTLGPTFCSPSFFFKEGNRYLRSFLLQKSQLGREGSSPSAYPIFCERHHPSSGQSSLNPKNSFDFFYPLSSSTFKFPAKSCKIQLCNFFFFLHLFLLLNSYHYHSHSGFQGFFLNNCKSLLTSILTS